MPVHPSSLAASKHGHVELWLDNLQTSCAILSSLGDALNVPILKGVVGVAIEIIKVAQTMKSNRKACRSLVQQVINHVRKLEACQDCTKEDMSHESRSAYEDLHKTLHGLRDLMERLSKKSFCKRLLARSQDKQDIADCKEKLHDAFLAFSAQNDVIQACHSARMARQFESLGIQVQSWRSEAATHYCGLSEQIKDTALAQHQMMEHGFIESYTTLKDDTGRMDRVLEEMERISAQLHMAGVLGFSSFVLFA